ncbi:hypothetical protein QR680_014251 [Steinernema hermaphroditum]|uniref:Uncharacterized protein n=1 Tax=Steinernema hermaphroditum TaxID=289476 RepID=A0AA39I886_9BILA|nr:hypothetical protein QR680_014251 [Steinernema hermaphroditum]
MYDRYAGRLLRTVLHAFKGFGFFWHSFLIRNFKLSDSPFNLARLRLRPRFTVLHGLKGFGFTSFVYHRHISSLYTDTSLKCKSLRKPEGDHRSFYNFLWRIFNANYQLLP